MRSEMEARILRQRQAELADAIDRLNRAPASSGSMLVKVVKLVAVPTEVGKYFACIEVDPGGAEGEANGGTFADRDGVLYVLVAGTNVPVEGDRLIAKPIGGRWVAVKPKSTPACNPATTTFNLTVYGCKGTPNVLPGATVTVSKTGVGVVASGTTDGSGQYSLGLLAPGAYTYTVTYPGLIETLSGGWTAFCGFSVTTTATFAVIAGTNVCCCNTRDYPPTLFLTTSAGTCTLTWSSGLGWTGSQTVNVPTYLVTGSTLCACDGLPPATRAVSVNYSVGCGSSPGQLFAGWTAVECGAGNVLPAVIAAGQGPCPFGLLGGGFSLPWPDPCTGLPVTFTFPASVPLGSGTCPCPISGSAVLSQ